MNGSASDQQLFQILECNIATITDVITTLRAIDDVLPRSDGLKWFNLLYLKVTQQVDTSPAGTWREPQWLTRLDVVFAQLYFNAVKDSLGAEKVATSWQALFEARFKAGIDRIQFALAGMNVHINHDLALALLQTDVEMSRTPLMNSPEHDDFERVNGLLEATLPQALTFLATGIVGQLAEDTEKIGRYLAIWNVRAARDLAWNFANNLRPLSLSARDVVLATQDQITGVLGRSLLL
jgi:hypothetical protein